jgi:hypothetical protein
LQENVFFIAHGLKLRAAAHKMQQPSCVKQESLLFSFILFNVKHPAQHKAPEL